MMKPTYVEGKYDWIKLLNMTKPTYVEGENGWIKFSHGGCSTISPGFYVFSRGGFKKIDDPSNNIYCLEQRLTLGKIDQGLSCVVVRMKKVEIVEPCEDGLYVMSNDFIIEPSNTFISFAHHPSKNFSECCVKMVLHEQLLNDPEHYDHLASEIRNDAFRELAIASVEDSSLFNELKKSSCSDNEFFKGSSEEILKIRATDDFILDLIKLISNEEMKRNEERKQKEKQRQFDEYIRQCEYEKSRRQREERERKLEEEYLRYKNTKYEENTSHYQPATYSRKR